MNSYILSLSLYSKLLALAKYMGVGRSRSIGFGQVDVVRANKH